MIKRADVVCGIAVGSTNTKVVAVTADGHVAYRAASATPRRRGGLLHAPDLLDSVETMLAGLADHGLTIAAACTAGVGEDGLLVGAGGEALCEVLPWYHPDRHAILEALAPELEPNPALPVRSDAARTIVGWRWARAQAGIDQARTWSALADWVASCWAGQAFMSDTLAARTAAWLPVDRTWDLTRVKATLGDPALLPPVLPAGEVIAVLRSARLEDAGVLGPDAVVVAGGHDHPLGGWAIHQLSPTAIVDSMGTAEVVVAQSPRPEVERTGVLEVGPGIQNAGSTILAVQELTRNVTWAEQDPAVAHEVRRLVSGEVRPTADLYDDSFVPAGAQGPEPYFTSDGPRDPLGRASAVLGRLARHGEEMLDAVASTLDAAPMPFATGGWARSPGWMAIKEQVGGHTFRRIAEPEVTAVAAAMLAGHAIGWDIPARRLLSESSAG